MGQALQKRRKHQICNSIGHKMTSEVIKQPTCTEDGLTRHYCTRRGCKYEYTTTAPVKLGHVSDSPKVYQPVTLNCATNGKTCTASRKWTQPCTRCGTNLNSGTDTATATVTSVVKTAATCTTKGTTTYTHKFSESWAPAQHTKDVQDIPVTSCASWQAPTYSWASNGSTCTATRKCNLNAHTQTSNATVTSAVKTQANCTTKGTTRYTATFSDSWATTQTKDIQDIAIDSSNHSWSVSYSWASNGSSCTATRSCGRSSSHNVTANATITSSVTTAATCTTWGKTTYTATFSGASWATTQTKVIQDVQPLDHSWSVSYSWASNGSSCTATRKCSRDSTHNLTSTATITSAVKIAATCTTKGTTTYTAKFSDSWATTQTKNIQDIAIVGCSWGTYSPTYSWASNGSSCTASQKCNQNYHTRTAAGTITSSVAKAATCNSTGDTKYTATFSGASWATTQTKTITGNIPKTACSWPSGTTNTTYSWNSTNSQCTATQPCTLNVHTRTSTVNSTNAVTKVATCVATGTRTYTAKFSVSYATTQTKNVTIAKDTSNHTNIVYGGTSAIHQKCTGCGVTTSSSHTYNQSNTNSTYLKSGATCTSPAVYYKSCVCGYSNKSTTFTSGSVNSSNHTGSAVNGGTSGVHTKYSCCGATISSQHSYTSTTTPANCQNYSSTKYTCSCGYSYTTTGNTYGDHVWQQGATGSTGYCTLCGYTCSHNNADYVSYQNGWHDLTCPDCGYTQYSQCTSNYSCTEQDGETFYWNCVSPTQHSFECAFCDYKITEDHTGFSTGECTKCGLDCQHKSGYYYGEQYPEDGSTWGCSYAEHEYYCSVCNTYLGRETCTVWASIVDNGNGTHTCTCSECKHSYTEAHYDECDGTCACGYQVGGGGSGGGSECNHSLTSSNMIAVNDCDRHVRSTCSICGYTVECGGFIQEHYWGCPEYGGTCQSCGAHFDSIY